MNDDPKRYRYMDQEGAAHDGRDRPMQDDVSASQRETALMYGPHLSSYRGTGVLTLENGGQATCRFDAFQLTDGSVLLLCDLDPPYPRALHVSAVGFEGRTEDGHVIVVSGDLMETNYLGDAPSDRDSSFLAAFDGQQMLVLIDPEFPAGEVRFGITNFIFFGSARARQVTGSGVSDYLVLPLQLRSQDTVTEVTIRPVNHYNKVAHQLRTVKGVDVTCEAVVKVGSDTDVDRATNVIDDLCYILSAARGTKIQWVYRDHYSAGDQLVKRLHTSRVTKPYGSLHVIDPRYHGTLETKAFIESAYPTYMQKRDAYRLHLGTIDVYLDAKAENDYLEVRGVKIAVSMEVLKNVFLRQAGREIQEYIMTQPEFDKIRKPLKKACETVLKEAAVGPEQRGLVYGKLSELNRTPVTGSLRRLCEDVGLQVSDEELRLVVTCRDRLVHTGAFYCDTAGPEERQKVAPLSSGVHEFFFLVNFMDRLFLKLLGYDGPYIDWTLPDKPTRRQMV